MPEPATGGRRWLWLSALVVVLDQATKALAEWFLEPGRSLDLLPVLALHLTHNRGAAFSLLADAGGWQRAFFIMVTVAVVAFLIHWLRRLEAGERLAAIALALVIGGALGNLVDRIASGEVVDFIDAHWQHWHWPAFNLADSAITVGVALLLWDGLRGKRRRDTN